MRETGNIPPRRDAPRRNAAWSGAVLGAGLGIATALSLGLLSSSVYGSFFFLFVVGPVLGLFGILTGAVACRRLCGASGWWGSSRSLFSALLVTLALVVLPFGVQTVQLYWIAFSDIPTYPGGERLETKIHRGPDATISVRIRTNASKEEVARYYEELWRQQGWSTDLDPAFFLYGAKKGQTIFLVTHEPSGEIQASWYRSYANH